MDYLKQSFAFKVKKVLRYLAMYGPRRTYMKILGQKHMRRTYTVLPPQLGNQKWYHTVGMIGCGNYAYSTIAYFLKKEFGDVIGACMDKDINRAASFASQYRVPYYSDNTDDVIKNPEVRLVYIASNHATHAEYAIKAMEFGKDVYIEKPHVVSLDQLHCLHAAMRKYDRKIFLGFNRPGSRFGRTIAEALSRESGPAVMNWFVVGHYLEPDHWYHNEGEGGRVLGNLCHWTDFVLGLVPGERFPMSIIPARWENSDRDMAVSFVFADGTVAAITFSSQGQTFDGVRESFRAQRGNTLYPWMTSRLLKSTSPSAKKGIPIFTTITDSRQNIVQGL